MGSKVSKIVVYVEAVHEGYTVLRIRCNEEYDQAIFIPITQSETSIFHSRITGLSSEVSTLIQDVWTHVIG
jgi:hypothetical protein